MPTAAQRLMPPAITECAARHPQVRIRLHDGAATEVVRRVASGEAELGLCSLPMPIQELLAEPLFDDAFVLVMRRDHPLARRRQVGWRDLAGEPLVMLDNSSGSRRVVEQALEQAGAEARVVLELVQPASVAAMVAAGIGLAAMPRLAAPLPYDPVLVARPLVEPGATRRIVLLRRPDRSLSPAADAVRHVLRTLWSAEAAPGGQRDAGTLTTDACPAAPRVARRPRRPLRKEVGRNP